MRSSTLGAVVLDRLPEWDIDVIEADVEIQRQPGELHFTFNDRPRFRILGSLRPPGGKPFDVLIQLKARQASVMLSDGSVVAPGQEIDITALRGALAASPHATALTLSTRNARSNSLQFRFSGEFPLAALKPVVEVTVPPTFIQF
jgi:hypothetical protein